MSKESVNTGIVCSYRILDELEPYRTIEYFEKRGFEFDKTGIPGLD